MEESGSSDAACTVLIVDDQVSFQKTLGGCLVDRGCRVWTACSFDEGRTLLELVEPDWVISELSLGGESLFGFLPEVSERLSLARLLVASVYPSLATAVRLARMGIGGYFTKPVDADAVLDRLAGAGDATADRRAEPPTRSSLDRTIWEYISQTYASAGSISEAARRLGLDRRSLRRMLAKNPPAR